MVEAYSNVDILATLTYEKLSSESAGRYVGRSKEETLGEKTNWGEIRIGHD